MTRICVYEDAVVENLEPVTLTRPMTEVFVGTSRILDKFLRLFKPPAWGLWLRPEMIGLAKCLYPAVPINNPSWLGEDDVILVNARWLPPQSLTLAPDMRVATGEDTPVIIRLARDQLAELDQHWPLQLNRLISNLPTQSVPGTLVRFPWDLIAANEELIIEEAPNWFENCVPRSPLNAVVLNGDEHNLYIDADTELEAPIVFDTRQGPVIVDRGVQIRAFSRIEGPCYIGRQAQILSARIGRGTTIGPGCRIGGEVEATVFQGWSNKYHDGFVGHSWIGEWVNIAAGVQISDLRHDYKPVPMEHRGRRQDTGLLKLGALIGDHTKLGLGVLVNTGSKFGIFCSVLPWAGYAPNVIPSFCQLVHGELRPYHDLAELLATASRVMLRRGRELSAELSDLYRQVYLRSAPERLSRTAAGLKWALRAGA